MDFRPRLTPALRARILADHAHMKGDRKTALPGDLKELARFHGVSLDSIRRILKEARRANRNPR